MLQKAVPILASLDAQQTIEFYTTKVGFSFGSNWDGYIVFSRDDIHIHLWPTHDESVSKNTGCYVNVTNVDLLCREYEAHGIKHPNGKLETKPWLMRQFSVLDNNGNIIHFGQDVSGGL